MKVIYPVYQTEYNSQQFAAPNAGQNPRVYNVKTGCNAIEFSLTNVSLTVVQTAVVEGIVLQTNGAAVGYGNHPEVCITKNIKVTVNAPTVGTTGGVLVARLQYMIPTSNLRTVGEIAHLIQQGVRVSVQQEAGDKPEDLRRLKELGATILPLKK